MVKVVKGPSGAAESQNTPKQGGTQGRDGRWAMSPRYQASTLSQFLAFVFARDVIY